MNKVLVTGAAGFIGSNLTRRLLEMGYHVVGVDNMSNGHKEFLEWSKSFSSYRKNGSYLEFWNLDFADRKILYFIKEKKFKYVFHQAAIPRVSYSVEKPFETTDTNINKTVALMEACISNVERFIFASSSSVYGGAINLPTSENEKVEPKSPYALQKRTIEEFCHLFGNLYNFDSACLRYFNVFGNNCYGDSPYSTAVSAWCYAVKKGLKLRSDGNGEQSRDMCYIDNVVDANILVATHEKPLRGEYYNVACGDRTSNNEILDFFINRFPNIEIEHAPERAGDVKHTQADISKIKEIGYEPKVKFWEGLEKTINWWGI